MVVKEHVLIWMSPDYTPLQWEEGRPVGLSFPDFFQTLVKSEKDGGVFPGLGAEDAVQLAISGEMKMSDRGSHERKRASLKERTSG